MHPVPPYRWLSGRTADSVVISSVVYVYDNTGNRTGMTDGYGTHSYSYDNIYRLTGAVHPSTAPLADLSEAFAYDAVGNRTQDNARTSYSYDGANRLNSDSVYTYSYDNNGNLTTRTRRSDNAQATYTYDVRNQLTRVVTEGGVTASYGYDVAGRRSWKTIAKGTTTYVAEHYVYNGDDIVAVTDQTGNVRSVYTHCPGVDEPLMLQRGTSVYFLLVDGLGSIMAVTDNAGNVVERVAYQAYGKPVFENLVTGSTASWSATGNRYSYTGREYESATGLYYYRARWYDAETGRFIQRDGIKETADYLYVDDDPINGVDPTGDLTIPFYGNINAGEFQAQKAAEWYADAYNRSGVFWKIGYGIGGLLATLWTPCTSDVTFTVLSSAVTFDTLVARVPYWRYVGPSSNPNSVWMTRGWKAPYGQNFALAKDKLQLPRMPTAVKKVDVPWYMPVRGPRIVSGNSQWGQGGGLEWAKGWRWPQ